MKKALSIVVILALLMLSLCACMVIEDETDKDNDKSTTTNTPENKEEEKTESKVENEEEEEEKPESNPTNQTTSSKLGNYEVVIESCRLAEDYSGEPIVIVKYKFTNNDDDASCFSFSIEDNVYQDGVGLNTCYFADDSANYSSDNQLKEIKTGVSLEVEVAYELNDTTTDVEVEVSELISLSKKKITKTFTIK